jgi:L,D-transpeptidase YbiS
MPISYQRLFNNSNRPPRLNRFTAVLQLQRLQQLKTQYLRPGRGWLALSVAAGLLLTALFVLPHAPAAGTATNATVKEGAAARTATKPDAAANKPSGSSAPGLASLREKNAALRKRIRGLAPAGDFLVIDTAGNKVFLRNGENNRAEMTASCGSGNILEDPDSGRRWVFDTPRGQFRIQSKLTNPVWMKPDWAFIEAGEAIPKNSAARAEPGMLGDYALGIGQGYFIHGTLYTRMLGRNVSHGCVRLGDKDLEHLYRNLPIGARVIIF